MIIFLSIFILLCIFMMGAFFGSFFSLATYRIPLHEDITHTRSYCPNCKHKLSFFDLVPIISYLVRRGKCKYCSNKISKRYILLESLNGIFFVLVYLIIYYIVASPMETLIYSMAFYIIYAIIFVLVGSKIMKNKMKSDDYNNLNKKGVFIAELIVAFVMFVVLTSSALVIMKNYSVGLNESQVKANIVQATIYKIENIKENAYKNGYDSLTSDSGLVLYNGSEYNFELNVTKYSEQVGAEYDFIKIIDVKLTRDVVGKNIEYSLSDLVFDYSLIN